jgi:bifunctional ADP-heptose synthase (sugar kinase/adenylyltransferase)
LAAGADLGEALELANVAASIVIHQLGTTGTASVDQIAGLLLKETARRPGWGGCSQKSKLAATAGSLYKRRRV